MVSHDLPRSTVTNQVAFDPQDLHSTPEFEHATDRGCQALVSELETSDTITFIWLTTFAPLAYFLHDLCKYQIADFIFSVDQTKK